MERQGAEVVAYDLSQEQDQDMVPYSKPGEEGYRQTVKEAKEHIRRINNGFWLAHRAYGSKANVVYGTAYEIPKEIGQVDVSVFGSVLLHIRDPFLALQSAACMTRETVVVTDLNSRRLRYLSWALRMLGIHRTPMFFAPNYRTCEPRDTWWTLHPDLLKNFLGVLGFEKSEVSYPTYQHRSGKVQFFTLVAHRTCRGGH
jgi:hypothetical protein